MRIDFRGYADDYTVRGELELEDERLSDALSGATEVALVNVVIRALDDGRTHELPSAVIPRDELCLVAATGPRGRSDRRIRTRPHPMRAVAGPYAIVGYVHAPPTADPRVTARRREVIVLSPATVQFRAAGEDIEETHDALLVLQTKLTEFESATDEDVGLPKTYEGVAKPDSHAKDLTGEVRTDPGR